nr:Platyhelminth-specific Rhodopsin-like Orphan Family 1 G protein-coupled receptor [Hymenolepis microstoma]
MALLRNSPGILPEDPNWPYLDSPWDLLRDCQYLASGAANASIYRGACILSHMLGFVSAFIFPFVGFFGIISNLFVTYVFLFVFRKPSRQMIYLACVSAADVATLILFGWIWMFPSKGLPYATGAHVYFFIFNVSNYSCKIFRYFYSFTSCVSSSIFLLTAFDRCLCIYFPLQFARISRKKAWEAVGVTTLLSALLMLPFGIMVEHGPSNGKTICWVHVEPNTLQIYHVFLANSSLIQTILVIIINIALLFRLRQSALLRESMSKCTSANREIAASMLLVILSTIVVISALPQSVAYILSTVLSEVLEGEKGRMAVRMAYNVSDLGWQLLFFQQATSWVLYMKRMKNFRRATFRLLRCHCHGGNWVEDAFESIHFLSSKARNLTSEIRITRADLSKVNWNLRLRNSNRRTANGLWKLNSSGVLNSNAIRNYENILNNSEVYRYTYRGSMRHTTTLSTISPGTLYADTESPSDPSPPNTGRIATRF